MSSSSVSSQMSSSVSEWSVVGASVIEHSRQLISAFARGDIADGAQKYQDYLYCYRSLKSSLKSKALELLSDVRGVPLHEKECIDSRLAGLKTLNGVVKRILAPCQPHVFSSFFTQNAVLECQAQWNQYDRHYPKSSSLSQPELETYFSHYDALKNSLKKLILYSPRQPVLHDILSQVRKLHRRVPHQVCPSDCKTRTQMISLSFLFMHLHFGNRDLASQEMCRDIFEEYQRLRELVRKKDDSIDPESLAVVGKEMFLLDRYVQKMAACLNTSLQDLSPLDLSQNRAFQKRARALRRETRSFISGMMRELKKINPVVVDQLRLLRSSLKQIKTLPNDAAIEKFQKKLVVSILQRLEQAPPLELKEVFKKLFSQFDLHEQFDAITKRETSLQPFAGIPQFFQYLPFLAMLQTGLDAGQTVDSSTDVDSLKDSLLMLEGSLLCEIDVDRANVRTMQISDPEKRLYVCLKIAETRIAMDDLPNAIREISDICSEIQNNPALIRDPNLKNLLIATVESLGVKILNSPDIAALTLGVSYCAIPNLIISKDPICYLKDSMLIRLTVVLMNNGYYYEALNVFSEIAHITNRVGVIKNLHENAVAAGDSELAEWIMWLLMTAKQQS